ncbi:hypothetical protein [Streptomyces sp. NPDC048669]|uniref:hypothetical protein n=1 Tax=Streptomyces sp. NPDC048669 TaxID=3155267 RepID=UPI0034476328
MKYTNHKGELADAHASGSRTVTTAGAAGAAGAAHPGRPDEAGARARLSGSS